MKWSWTTHILWRVSKRNYFFHYKKQFQELLQKIVIMKGFFQLCSPQYNNNVGHLNSDPYWRHLSPVCKLTYISLIWKKITYIKRAGAHGSFLKSPLRFKKICSPLKKNIGVTKSRQMYSWLFFFSKQTLHTYIPCNCSLILDFSWHPYWGGRREA